MAAGKLSPLQMTDATQWSGLTTENNLAKIWQKSPQKVTDQIMMVQQQNFGNNIDTVLSRFPSLDMETDDSFVWELQSQAQDNIPLHECRINGTAVTPADKIGKNFTTFELVFNKKWFSMMERIVGELNELYPIRIISEPEQDGMRWIYTCKLDTGDPDMVIPYEEVVAGKRFSREFAPVQRTLSDRGRELTYKSMLSMRNDFSQIRIQKKTPGNMIGRKMGSYFMDEKGKPVVFWHHYESYMFDNAFREDINKLLMFGTSNKSADNGDYPQRGENGYEIVEGAGIRQQMESANTSYYSTFSIEELSSRLLDLSEGKLGYDQREFVMRTGERGAYEFHKALESYSQLFTPLWNQDRMYTTNSGISKMELGYGGQFVEYKGPNNIKVNLSIDSMYDDRNRNKLHHPNGGVVESYRYDVFDIGTSMGKPNIQKVTAKSSPTLHRYIPGMRDPFSPTGEMAQIAASSVDGWEEHKMYCGATIVRDPSRTLSFIHSMQAGY